MPPLKRTRNRRPQKKTALVVGEGEQTEYNYFVALNRDDRSKYSLTVRRGVGRSPKFAVNKAINVCRTKKFDEVWVILDVERDTFLPDLKAAMETCSSRNYKVCLSNPAIEVWFLSHFAKRSRSYDGCGPVITSLNVFWRKEFGCVYDKADVHIYKRLKSRLPDACANAKWAREASPEHRDKICITACNSSTEIYRLIERFLNL
jgi:hypothetical protein